MRFQYEDKTKYRIKKPMCATCLMYLPAFVERNCIFYKDLYGRTFKKFEPTDVCNNYAQVGDGQLESTLSDVLKKGLMDGSIEKK